MAETLGKVANDVGKAVKSKVADPLAGVKKFTAQSKFEHVHELSPYQYLKVLKDGTDIKFDFRSMFIDRKNMMLKPSYKGVRMGLDAWQKLKSLMKTIE